MTDQFSDWDMFYRHFTLTQDPHKALKWTRYELWSEKRRRKLLKDHAEFLALESKVKTIEMSMGIDRERLVSSRTSK
jgi:hypothetical protein